MSADGGLPPPPARVHVTGAGGVGMSAVARLLLEAGYVVSGSDLRASPITEALAALGVSLWVGGPDVEAVRRAAALVYPPSVPASHPERAAAAAVGARALDRDAALAALLVRGGAPPVVGVTGIARRGLCAHLIAAALPGSGLFCGMLRRDGAPYARLGAPMVAELDDHAPPPCPLAVHVIADLGVGGEAPRPRAPAHVSPLGPQADGGLGFVYEAPGRAPQALRAQRVWADRARAVWALRAEGDLSPWPCALPAGGDAAAAAVAAAALLRFHWGAAPGEVIAAIERTAPALCAQFDVLSASPWVVHDVRTYAHTVGRALDDLRGLGAAEVHLVFRPYPPTFDLRPLGDWVARLRAPGLRLTLLADYHDPRAPRAAALGAALGVPVVDPDRDLSIDLGPDACEGARATLGVGGDDVRAALLRALPTPASPPP